MNKSNTNYLLKKYPKIFRQHKLPMSKTAMCCLFQHGDGWLWLLDNLCNYIQNRIKWNIHLKIPQVEATEIKEKYGSLCFYYTGGDENIAAAISFAEHLSEHICESCGSIKDIHQNKTGYIRTLCNVCRLAEGL